MESTIIFLISILYIILALLVFFRNPRLRISIIFLSFVGFIVIWVLSNYFESIVSSHELAIALLKLDFVSASFIFYFFLLICINFPTPKQRLLDLILLSFPAIIFSISSMLGLVVNNFFFENGMIKFEPVILYLPYSIYIFSYAVFGLFELLRKYRKTKGLYKMQILYVLIGLSISASIGIITNLILPLFNVPIEVNRIGIYGLIFFIGFTAYAIVRHRLMDIRLLVVKSIIYTLLFVVIGIVYTFSIFILGAFVFKDFTGREAYWAAMIVALTVAFTFQPLKRIFTRWTDRVFFKDQYNFEELTSKLNEVATSTIILSELLYKFLDNLIEEMRLTRGAFILLEDNKKIYDTESLGYKQALCLEDNEIKTLLKIKKPLIFDELEEGRKEKEIMRKYNTSIVLSLQTEGNVIGFLFLGEKKSGDIYSAKDIQVLEIIISQLALGVQNAKAYEKAQKFNLILRAEVNRATKELRNTNQRLQETDKAKDEFISMASHEIRTPIASLEGYLSMLNNQKLDQEQIEEVSRRSYESITHLATLVKDLLDVSRIEQKRMKLAKEPTRIERVIQHTIEGFELQAHDKGIYVKFQKPDKMLPEINIDPDRISEVFNNLIGNAMKFTEKGGITIGLKEGGGQAVVSVSDTGIGIDKKSLPSLFQKFYQAQEASSALSNERGGTGLGLYITKNIIEMHDGKIWVESEKNKGTTFYFTLPISG